jgi:hypothetical protein
MPMGWCHNKSIFNGPYQASIIVRKGASFWKVTLSLPADKDEQDCDRYSVES